MAELADAQDLGSCAVRCAGSTPVTRTIVAANYVLFAAIFIFITWSVVKGHMLMFGEFQPHLRP